MKAALRVVMMIGSLAVSLAAVPCQGQFYAFQLEVGSEQKVTTKTLLSLPSVFATPYFLLTSKYRLEGTAVVDDELKQYDSDWITKVDIGPAIAIGKEDSMSRSATDPAFSFNATAKSSIKTDPIGIGLSVGAMDVGLVIGIKSVMEVEATIAPLDPTDFTMQTSALAFVHDPFHFTNFSSDDALALTSILQAGDILKAQWGSGTVLRSLVASTDIPGMETLYRLDITATPTGLFTGTAADLNVAVSFTSDPALGISDADITAAVLNALVYNDTGGYYEFASAVTLFDGFIEIPDHIQDFSLAIDEIGLVSTRPITSVPWPPSPTPTPIVPEPSGLLLMVAATFAMLMPMSGQRMRQWFFYLRRRTCPPRSPVSVSSLSVTTPFTTT
jgi:hypothetical protein